MLSSDINFYIHFEPSKTVPIDNWKLALSKCQKIFLCEFDEPQKNKNILVTVTRI